MEPALATRGRGTGNPNQPSTGRPQPAKNQPCKGPCSASAMQMAAAARTLGRNGSKQQLMSNLLLGPGKVGPVPIMSRKMYMSSEYKALEVFACSVVAESAGKHASEMGYFTTSCLQGCSVASANQQFSLLRHGQIRFRLRRKWALRHVRRPSFRKAHCIAAP